MINTDEMNPIKIKQTGGKMKKLFCVPIVLGLILSGCAKPSVYQYTVYNDTEMKDSIKTEAEHVIAAVEKNILEGNAELSPQYLSSDLQKNPAVFEQITEEISKLEVKQNRLLGNYYIESKGNITNGVSLTYLDGESEMQAIVPVETKAQFYRATILERKGLNYMMFQIYVRESGSWKLASIHVMDYGYDGKSPYDLYKQIQIFQEKDDTISLIAYCNMLDGILNAQAEKISHPFMTEYQELKQGLAKSIDTEEVLSRFKTEKEEELSIVSFEGKCLKEGKVLMLYGITSASLEEEVALKELNKKIVEELKEKLPETIQNFDFVAIREYNELPTDPNKTYAYYGNIMEVN